jgi:DNA anti-recombination protein RmuC
MSKIKEDANRSQTLEGGNINQIRNILIGPLQREQEARFARLEQLIERYSTEAADRSARSQEKLEKTVEAAVTGLQARIAELGKRLQESEKTLRTEATQSHKELERQATELQTRLTKELQDNDRQAGKRLENLRTEIDATFADMRDEKTSRHDLGDYLTEIGLRLKGDADLSALDASLQDALDAPSQRKQS